MAIVAREIARLLEELAPRHLAEEWDNVGWQIGDSHRQVDTVLVALDASSETLAEAERIGAQLVVTHHPLIFRPLRRLCSHDAAENLIIRYVEAGMSVYSAHTNLDKAPQGTSTVLADVLDLTEVRVLEPCVNGPKDCGLGRIGLLPFTMDLDELCQLARDRLGVPSVMVTGDPHRPVRKVAAIGGSGGSYVRRSHLAGADVLLTGDVKYHDAEEARMLDLAVIDAGHAATENPVVRMVCEYLRSRLAHTGLRVFYWIGPPVSRESR